MHGFAIQGAGKRLFSEKRCFAPGAHSFGLRATVSDSERVPLPPEVEGEAVRFIAERGGGRVRSKFQKRAEFLLPKIAHVLHPISHCLPTCPTGMGRGKSLA